MIIGHKKQQEKLKTLFEKEKIPHAFLFSGPEFIGKRKVAFWFLKMINCERGGERLNCSCSSCCEIEDSLHTDITEICSLKKEIQLEQIEEVIKKSYYKSTKARFKGIVIDNAHLMNLYAQNSLLKILEEPPERTIIFLITPFKNILFSTVVSRTFEIKFSIVAEKEIEKKIGDKEISKLSLGRPGLALDYLNVPQRREKAEKIRKRIEKMVEKEVFFRFSEVKKVIEEDDVDIFLNFFLKFTKERMIKNLKMGKKTKKNREVIAKTEEVIYLLSKTNLNKQIALEEIMLKI